MYLPTQQSFHAYIVAHVSYNGFILLVYALNHYRGEPFVIVHLHNP